MKTKKEKMLKVTIEVEGKRVDDVVLGLQEVMQKIREGYKGGHDSNDDGYYEFSVEGIEE